MNFSTTLRQMVSFMLWLNLSRRPEMKSECSTKSIQQKENMTYILGKAVKIN
jgi:hypothetical protein